MSLESMKRRLEVAGGANPQDRMIKDKLKSFLSAVKYSYQAAKFTKLGEHPKEFKGLFNPVTHTENYDTKMISAEFGVGLKVGDYFKWENTGTNWIIYMEDKTELAHFRGEARLCNYSTKWVDGNRQVQETMMSVIGPSITSIGTSTSTTAMVVQDYPNANLVILIQDNPVNRDFFYRYQTFLLDGTTYRVEQVDQLSMKGVLQLHATEHYTNTVEDDPATDTRNVWNVQPVMPEYYTEYGIDGPQTISPQTDTVFTTNLRGGTWDVLENVGVTNTKFLNPATILNQTDSEVTIHWNSLKSGMFTLEYRMESGSVYQRAVYAKSLF